MVKSLFHHLGILLLLSCFLSSCSSDDEGSKPISVTAVYNFLMFVTNDSDEDLILKSDKYFHTVNEFRFDTWEVYLDDELIQTADDTNKYYDREVNYLQRELVNRKNVLLNAAALEIERRIDDVTEKHVAEFVVSSSSLFGDTEKHTIHVEFRLVENRRGYTNQLECFITVDNVKQEVFYPTHYDDMSPTSEYGAIKFPYFVLNVDDL